MKKIYLSLLAAVLAWGGVMAQDNLEKEITLPKDFVPVEKKTNKRTGSVPKARKVTTTSHTTLSYSDWASPAAFQTQIPTLLPYGYRTLHNFSEKRGYADLGFGLSGQADINGNIGYRIVDNEHTKLSAWLQHNSSWNGKNETPTFDLPDSLKLKQKFADNRLGIDLTQDIAEAGTLSVSLMGHLDNFSYYGGRSDWFDDNRQLFSDLQFKANWDGHANVADDAAFNYAIGANFGHAGYRHSPTGYYETYGDTYGNFNYANMDFKGAVENHFQVSGMFEYAGRKNTFGASIIGDVVSRNVNTKGAFLPLAGGAILDDKIKDDFQMITVSPYYDFTCDFINMQLGANVNFSFSDGAKVRLSPNVKLDFDIAKGATIYVDAQGGKRLNLLPYMAALNRYSDPLGRYQNTFSPIDGEAGFKIGPFDGLSFKLFAGYGVFRHEQFAYLPVELAIADGYPTLAFDDNIRYAYTTYRSFNARGAKYGAEAEYKFRTFAGVNLKFVYAPQDDDISADKHYGGYTLGLDRAKCVFTADVKLYPINKLAIGLGYELRSGRKMVQEYANANERDYSMVKFDDLSNLKLDASYRITDMLTVWLRSGNILSKKYDFLYGMGAQRFNLMVGAGVVF